VAIEPIKFDQSAEVARLVIAAETTPEPIPQIAKAQDAPETGSGAILVNSTMLTRCPMQACKLRLQSKTVAHNRCRNMARVSPGVGLHEPLRSGLPMIRAITSIHLRAGESIVRSATTFTTRGSWADGIGTLAIL